MKRTKSDLILDAVVEEILSRQTSAPGFEEARDELRISKMSKEERREYYNYLDNMNSMRGVVEFAVDKAKLEGRMEERDNIIRTMYSNEISQSAISSMTGIDLATIERILSENT